MNGFCDSTWTVHEEGHSLFHREKPQDDQEGQLEANMKNEVRKIEIKM